MVLFHKQPGDDTVSLLYVFMSALLLVIGGCAPHTYMLDNPHDILPPLCLCADADLTACAPCGIEEEP